LKKGFEEIMIKIFYPYQKNPVMKNHLLLIVFMCCASLANAQDEEREVVIHASTKIAIEATPRQIIDSLKKRFPNARAVQYYKTSAAAAKAGWKVEEDNEMGFADDLDAYTISFKRNDFQYYALFDADGNLLKSKYQENGTKLPAAVKTSLQHLAGDNAKNYTVVSRTYFKRVDHKGQREYYEVTAVNNKNKKDRKTITVASDGTIISQ
jgi:hypothetical protein